MFRQGRQWRAVALAGLALSAQVLPGAGAGAQIVHATSVRPDAGQTRPDVDGGWGLDRLDQREMQLNNRYNFLASAGQNVDVYVIDSGIRESANDPEFAGRVLLGANTVSGETPSHPDSSDCSTANHGTPVAGLIGGQILA